MKLVFVHGRAQQGKDPIALKDEWLDALSYGMQRANMTLPADVLVEFPFYGDVLADLVERGVPLVSEVITKGAHPDEDEAQALRGEILAEIAAGVDVASEDIAKEMSDVPVERGPGNWEWVQATLRAIDRVPGLNAAAIDRFTRDVFVYLTKDGVRRRVNQIVEDAVGEGPCVVVAHSLGTVVAYNVLHGRQATPRFPRLITLGSPLGIRAIRSRITKPLRSPACIENWFNAYDDRDPVALNPLDARNFDVDPPIENKRDIKNFTDNRHGIAGYLADAIVARKIAEALR